MHQKISNIFRISTVVKNEQDNFVSSFGGVIVTLASRNDINTIYDLKNKKISAVGKGSLGAYQSQVKEMIDNGVSVKNKLFTFSGLPQEKTLSLLLDHKVDVAFVRTGLIEKLVQEDKLDLSKLKIINLNKANNYPFLLSTKLYPEWPFAAMSHIDNWTIKAISSALMNIKPTDLAAIKGEYYGWSTPQEYNVVRDLLYDLNLPPYERRLDFSLSDVVEKYNTLASIFFSFRVFL